MENMHNRTYKTFFESNLFSCLCSALLTAVIVLAAFAYNRIYPFGPFSVANGDMINLTIPFNTLFKDALLGDKSFIYDFSAGMGTNILHVYAMIAATPWNFLQMLLPQDNAFLWISVFTALRLVTCALTASICLAKCFDTLPVFWKVSLSVLYATSGYAMFTYYFLTWVDVMSLFPIVILGLNNLLKKKSAWLYITALTASLLINFYIGLLEILLLFIFGGVVLISFGFDTENRKRCLFSFSCATVISMLLGGVMILPNLMQILNASTRTNVSLQGIINLKNQVFHFYSKLNYHLFSICILFISIYLLIRNWKALKYRIGLMLILFLCVWPVFFESSNLLLHFGNYQSFSLRAGFVYQFAFILIIAHIVTSVHGQDNTTVKRRRMLVKDSLFSFLTIGCVLVCLRRLFTIKAGDVAKIKHFSLRGVAITEDNEYVLIVSFLFALALFFTFLTGNKKLRCALLGGIFVVQSFMTVNILTDPLTEDENRAASFSAQYNALQGEFDETYYSRIKDIEGNLPSTSHYMLYGINSLSINSNSPSADMLIMWSTMGYTADHTRPLDIGGSLFSDSLLGYKYVHSRFSVDKAYYEPADSPQEFALSKFKGYIPIGQIMLERDLVSEVGNSYPGTVFDFQNDIFNSLGYSEDLFEVVNVSEADLLNMNLRKNGAYNNFIYSGDGSQTASFTIPVQGRKQVYLDLTSSEMTNSIKTASYNRINVYLNGNETSYSVSNGSADTSFFPNPMNNGLLNLGQFENETVSIRIEFVSTGNATFKSMAVGLMDLNIFDAFLSDHVSDAEIVQVKGTHMTIELTGKAGTLLLPLMYDNGLTAKLDGEKVPVQKILGNFTGVVVSVENKTLEISYVSPGLLSGIALSCIMLCLVLLFFSTKIRIPDKVLSILANTCYYVYAATFCGIVILIYIAPVLSTFYRILLK